MISCQMEAGPIKPTSPEIEKPESGPRLGTDSADFDFKAEVDQVPFKIHIGKEANLT